MSNITATLDRILGRWCVAETDEGYIIAEAEDVVVDCGDGQVIGTRWVLAAGPADSVEAAVEELVRDVEACRLADEQEEQ